MATYFVNEFRSLNTKHRFTFYVSEKKHKQAMRLYKEKTFSLITKNTAESVSRSTFSNVEKGIRSKIKLCENTE